MEEQILADQIKAGNETAFQQLVELYQRKVVNTCFGFLKNNEDAEDTAQEVFLEVYRSVPNFRGDSKISTWIYRISVTKSLDALRKRNRKKRLGQIKQVLGLEENIDAFPDEYSVNPDKGLENEQRFQILHQAIGSLVKNQKIALILNKFEGLSHAEIAEIMDTSVSAVESLIHRAKKNLRKKLKHVYENYL